MFVTVLGYLGEQQFHFEWFRVSGKDHPECLGERCCEAHGSHVLARIEIAHQVGLTDPGLSQSLELVVFPDTGERDAVIHLRDLVQCRRRILGQ